MQDMVLKLLLAVECAKTALNDVEKVCDELARPSPRNIEFETVWFTSSFHIKRGIKSYIS